MTHFNVQRVEEIETILVRPEEHRRQHEIVGDSGQRIPEKISQTFFPWDSEQRVGDGGIVLAEICGELLVCVEGLASDLEGYAGPAGEGGGEEDGYRSAPEVDVDGGVGLAHAVCPVSEDGEFQAHVEDAVVAGVGEVWAELLWLGWVLYIRGYWV